jgi:hypothetical protein
MASKKPAPARKPAARPKSVPSPAVVPPPASPAPAASGFGEFKRVWTLPTALLMLIVAASGLWLALRESSSAPQAATHDVTTAIEPTATRPVVLPAIASPAKAVETVPPHDDGPAPVSITGCLQKTDTGFVLKNTDGADAPKSRSWKSGFLKRSNAAIDLEDSGAHLSSHVGQRVSVTGPLVDREMKAESLQRLAATCQ